MEVRHHHQNDVVAGPGDGRLQVVAQGEQVEQVEVLVPDQDTLRVRPVR
jgi:hypothetical protein